MNKIIGKVAQEEVPVETMKTVGRQNERVLKRHLWLVTIAEVLIKVSFFVPQIVRYLCHIVQGVS